MKNFQTAMTEKWIPALRSLLLITAGIICGVLLANCMEKMGVFDDTDGSAIFIMIALLLGIYLALFLQIIIHESGHLFFGLMTGYTFSSFRIGSFILIKKQEKLQFSRMSLMGTGGQCLMNPPDIKNGKLPYKLYNLGGALSNLISAFAFFATALSLRPHPLVYTLLMLLSLFGLIYALLNAIPMHMGPVDNDGMNTLMMGKNPEALRAFWLQLKMNQAQIQGIRLKDMPEEWFQIPSDEDMKNPMIASIGVFASSRLMDEHRFEKAEELMAHLLSLEESGIAGLYRQSMICDRIFCELINENRSEVIIQFLSPQQKKFMNSMKDSPAVLRTAYADALLHRKDLPRAEELKKDFEKCLLTHPYEADAVSEQELVALCTLKCI